MGQEILKILQSGQVNPDFVRRGWPRNHGGRNSDAHRQAQACIPSVKNELSQSDIKFTLGEK